MCFDTPGNSITVLGGFGWWTPRPGTPTLARPKTYTHQEVLDAIEASEGIVADAARTLGCCRQTVYTYINDSEDLRDALSNARETALDDLEATAFRLARKGNVKLLMFILSRLGRDRGWGQKERVIIDGVFEVDLVPPPPASDDDAPLETSDSLPPPETDPDPD